jgi:hypothetical protein
MAFLLYTGFGVDIVSVRLIGITKGQDCFIGNPGLWLFLQKVKEGKTMTRFLVAAFLVFVLGIGALYAGFNRVPFRQEGAHEMHNSSQSSVIITGGNVSPLPIIPNGKA